MITPLHPLERGFLYASGILKFRPPAPEIRARSPHRPTGRTPGRKNSTTYGKVKKIAVQFLDAGAGARLPDFASRYRVSYESLKGAVWKIRRERQVAA